MNNFFYKVNGKDIEVVVSEKKIRNIYYRYKDHKIYISCPRFTSKSRLEKGLDKYASKLVKDNDPTNEKGIYLFGQFYELNYPGNISIGGQNFSYIDNNDLISKLKSTFLTFITSRVRYYEELMNVPSYKIRVQKMSTRFGSNSKKTKILNFNLNLMHFDTPIIDSVVVHELAHILVYNHSNKFYDVVYKYCPEYNKYRKMLLRGIYHA